jgi:hypothetical protein
MSVAAFPATSGLTSSDWSAIFSAYVSGWATRLRPKRPPRLEGTGATGAGTVVVDAAPDGPWVVSFDDRGVFSDDIALTVEGRGTKAPLSARRALVRLPCAEMTHTADVIPAPALFPP